MSAESLEAALSVLETQGAEPAEREGLLYRLAQMSRYADPRQALALLDDALPLAREAGDPLLAAYVACARGYLRCTGMAEVRRGLAELEAGMAEFDALPPAERGRLAALQEALGDPPDEHHYRGALASWLALAGRYAEAQAQAERVLAATPDPAAAVRGAGTSFYANACRGLASAHAALGRPDEARRAYSCAREAYRAVVYHFLVVNTLA